MIYLILVGLWIVFSAKHVVHYDGGCLIAAIIALAVAAAVLGG